MLVAFNAKKNTALKIITPVFDAEWAEYKTGAAGLDSEISQDGGAFGDCTNELTEIGSTGVYYLSLTAAELNYDTVLVKITTTTDGAKIPCFFINLQNIGIGAGPLVTEWLSH